MMIRVSLIEDSLPEIQRMEEILNRIQHDEKLNLQITVFQDGESFSSIPPHSFDLALLDIQMDKWMKRRQPLKSENRMRI